MSLLCLELPSAPSHHLKWNAKSLPRPLWAQPFCFALDYCSSHASFSFSFLKSTKISSTSEFRTFSSSACHGPPQVAAWVSLPCFLQFCFVLVSSGHFVREKFWMILSLEAHPHTLFIPFTGFVSPQNSYNQWHNIFYVFAYSLSSIRTLASWELMPCFICLLLYP